MDSYRILKHFTAVVNVLFLSIILFNYLNFLPGFWGDNLSYVFFFVVAVNTLFFAFKINKIPEAVRDKSSMIYYFSHFFLLGLVVITLNQFLRRQFIIDFMPELTALSIALGFLTFYAHRNRVEKEIEDEKVKEEEAEKKRKEEFGDKFPRLNKIPLLGIFVKWMYKEGWAYSVGLIAIVILGFVLRIWNLGNVPFWYDELLHISVFEGIANKILPYWSSGMLYSRSFPISYIAYIGSRFFGSNEFGIRFLFLFFYPLIIILGYFLTKKVFNKFSGIIYGILICFNPINIIVTQEVRYYSFLSLLSLLFFFILFSNFRAWIKYLLLIVIIWFGLNSSMIMLPFFVIGFLIYFFLSGEIKNIISKKRYFPYIIFFFFFFVYELIKIMQRIIQDNYFDQANIFNSSFSLSLFGGMALLIFFIISYLIVITKKNDSKRYALMITPLTLFILLSILNTRFGTSSRYLTFLLPLIIIISSYSLLIFLKIFLKKRTFIVPIILLVLFLTPTYFYFQDDNHFLTKQEFTWARPDYGSWGEFETLSEATIVSNVPHITKFYYGRVDYWLDDSSLKEVEDITGIKRIKELKDLEGCILLLADYRESYMFNQNTKNYLAKNFNVVDKSRQTKIYLSKNCNG